jgi:hypothetical protein
MTVVGLLLVNSAHAASIYKCTRPDKTVIFTDQPCVGMEVKLIHQETEQEIKRRLLDENTATIKRLIADNQTAAAKEYALKHNLSEVYAEQIGLSAQQKMAEERQATERDKQEQIQIQQQTLAVQKQQLELQKQQIALDKTKEEQQKQLLNNPPYYVYPYLTPPINRLCQPYANSQHCFQSATPKSVLVPQSSFGVMNPPSALPMQMNPPQIFPSPMNPPSALPAQMNPPQSLRLQGNPR